MNAHPRGQKSAHATALAWISASAVVLLLLIFFGVVSTNTSLISDQITLILDGPASARTEASCIVIQDSLHQLALATSILTTSIVVALIACIAMLKRKGTASGSFAGPGRRPRRGSTGQRLQVDFSHKRRTRHPHAAQRHHRLHLDRTRAS